MRLEGLHHITAITGDAPRNVDFYTRVHGPADGRQDGQPGRSDRLPPVLRRRARPPRLGADVLRVPGRDRPAAPAPAWCTRSSRASGQRRGARLLGAAPAATRASPRRARRRHAAVRRLRGPRARARRRARTSTSRCPPSTPRSPPSTRSRASTACARTRSPRRVAARCWRRSCPRSPPATSTWELRGDRRGATITYDAGAGGARPPERRHRPPRRLGHDRRRAPGAGSTLLQSTGVPNSGIIDRHYFHSIYFREPSGVLFEIADDGPGFTVDVPLEQLGSDVILPPRLESRRREIEARLTPLPDPRGRAGRRLPRGTAGRTPRAPTPEVRGHRLGVASMPGARRSEMLRSMITCRTEATKPHSARGDAARARGHRLGRRPSRLQPRRRPAPRSRGAAARRLRCRRRRPRGPLAWAADRGAEPRPSRRAGARRRDAPAHHRSRRRRDRRPRAPRPRPGRSPLGRRHRSRLAHGARPGGRLLPDRRRGGRPARQRHGLAGPQPRRRRPQRDGGRVRHG